MTDWATSILGRSPTTVRALRPATYVDDNWWGAEPLGDPARFAMLHCAQTDVYDIPHAALALIVIHGAPSWLDPARPYDPKHRSEWQLTGRSVAGVRLYKSIYWRHPGMLFVLPSSTWILAGDVMAERLAELYTHDASEPPLVPARQGSMFESYSVGDPTRFPGVSGWILRIDLVKGGGVVMYPPRADGSVPTALKLVFAGASDASAAGDDARRQLAGRTLAEHAADSSDKEYLQTVTLVEVDGEVLFLDGVLKDARAQRLLGNFGY